MYIAPNSTVKLLHGIPLDPTYEHSIYFTKQAVSSGNSTGKSEQLTYFNNHVKSGCTFSEQSYQRHGKNKIRLQALADNIYDCNYMMFQNTAYGNKWFYAFITDIEYVNNLVSEITYQVDSLQTWYFDFDFGDCFIERRHTEYDEWTSNCPEIYTEEQVNKFDYLAVEPHTVFDMNSMYIVILSDKKYTDTATGQQHTEATSLINNMPVPMKIGYCSFNPANPGVALAWMDGYIDLLEDEAVVSVYLCPAILLNSDPSTAYSGQVSPLVNKNSLHGYTPNNKKMLGYPFNILEVSNNCGQSVTYKLESFTGSGQGGVAPGTIQFIVSGTSVTTPCAVTYPLYYEGKNINYDTSVTYNAFPQLPWAGDIYKSWMAQNKTGMATGNLQNLFNEIPSAVATGSVTAATDVGAMAAAALFLAQPELALAIGVAAAGAHFTAHLIGNEATKDVVRHSPSKTYGKVLTESLNTAINRVQFDFYNMQIRAEEAKIADNYFSKFGYTCNRVLKPKIRARSKWTFIKTRGCVLINDNLPAPDAKAICSIMDNGITFWVNGATVGDYDMANNSPLGSAAQ